MSSASFTTTRHEDTKGRRSRGIEIVHLRALRAFVRNGIQHTRAPRHISRALRRVRTELAIERRHRRGARKAAALAGGRPPRLNFGIGSHPQPGWIDIDIADPRADLQLDLRERLPFADASVEAIYAANVLDRLTYANPDDSTSWTIDTPSAPSAVLALLRECRRVLLPGGHLDVVVPDAEPLLAAYAARGEPPFAGSDWEAPPWCDTPMHRVNYLFRHGSERQYAYDFETLQRVLERAGFSDIVSRACDPDFDMSTSQPSLFVRAWKERT
jgi:predicted SAM-dependent methyltransferase